MEKRMLFLGMYPWNYPSLSDTVRSMVREMKDTERDFINPFAEQRRIAFSWRITQEEGVTVWHPPFGWIPTRHGLYRMRQSLQAQTLEPFLSRRLGGKWQDQVVFYLTSATIELGYLYVQRLQPRRYVFDIVDDNLSFPGISPSRRVALTKQYTALLQGAALVTAVSDSLVQQAEKIGGRRVHLLPNGVDVERFRPPAEGVPEPEELQALPHPRLLFMGALTAWIDLQLLWKVAHHESKAQLILVGPKFDDALDQETFARLCALPNVHWLGPKPYAEVPRYLHHADVLLLPRTKDAYSLACDPLKLYEYLATGKPVVTTAFPSAERFRSFLEIGEDDAAFIAGVKRALTRESINEEQIRRMESLSWQARGASLWRLLEHKKDRGSG